MSPQFWDVFRDTDAAPALPSASGGHFREQGPDVAPDPGVLDGQWGLPGGQQPGLGEIPVVRTLLPHKGIEQGTGRLHPLGSALATNQASVASKGQNPWERCGEELWSCSQPTSSREFWFVLYFGGCSQRKSVTRRGQEPLLAPTEQLKGSSGTDTRGTGPQPKAGQAVQLFGT